MNELVTTGGSVEFSSELIKRRGFLRGKFWSWDDWRNGLVTFADKKSLRVLFQTGVNASTSYYTVKVAEVEAGLWDLIYSNDMQTFYRVDSKATQENRISESDVADLFRDEQITHADVAKIFEEG